MIGNQPSLTNNAVARTISVTATAGQTLFTVTGGYRINQLGVFRNGTRLVDALDYNARDGATVTLLSPANASDVLEFQVFDDFRVADALNVNSGGTVNGAVTIVSAATTALLVEGNARVTGILTVGNSSITFDGTNNSINIGSVSIAETGITGGTSDIVTRNITGVAATFTGNVSIAGTLTYEDVTNIDSVGLITARSGIVLTGGNVTLGTGVTASGSTANTFTLSTGGSERLGVDSSGNINVDSGGVYYDAVNNRLAVGTTSPTANRKLTIKSGGGDAGISIVNTADNTVGLIVPENTTTSQELGIYSLSNMRLYTGGTQRAAIDTSGRLLVGTSSARGNFSGTDTPQFQVEGNSFNTSTISVVAAQSTGGGNIELGSTGGTTVGGTGTVTTNGYLGSIHFLGGNGTNLLKAAAIDCQVDGTVSGGGTNDMPGRLVFSTTADGASSPTPHYTISSSGYFAITSNVGLYNLRQTSYNASSNAVLGLFGASNSDGTNNGAVYNIEWKMNGNANGQFWYANYITSGGSRTLGAYCTGTAWTNSSDIANKEEIVDTRYGLDTVLSLRPVDFRWKSQRDENGNGKPDIGFIAQEMEQIVPEVVTGAEGSKGISYGNLVSVLTKAIQEQQAMISELQAKVAALEAA